MDGTGASLPWPRGARYLAFNTLRLHRNSELRSLLEKRDYGLGAGRLKLDETERRSNKAKRKEYIFEDCKSSETS